MPETQGINQKPLEQIHKYIYIAWISEHIDEQKKNDFNY